MEKNKHYKIVDENGETRDVWDGRYGCVVSMVFSGDQDGTIYVLANKRGVGCPKEVGKWNMPCGFIDAGTGEENASREVFEETGILIPPEEFKQLGAKVDDKDRNITVRYIAGVEGLPAPAAVNELTGEPNEVEEIKWIPLHEIPKYEWAFDHDEIILDMVKRIVHAANVVAGKDK